VQVGQHVRLGDERLEHRLGVGQPPRLAQGAGESRGNDRVLRMRSGQRDKPFQSRDDLVLAFIQLGQPQAGQHVARLARQGLFVGGPRAVAVLVQRAQHAAEETDLRMLRRVPLPGVQQFRGERLVLGRDRAADVGRRHVVCRGPGGEQRLDLVERLRTQLAGLDLAERDLVQHCLA